MATRNEFVRITEREWDALTESVEHLSNAVERMEREQLVFKAKAGVWMFILGSAGGLVMTIAGHFITKLSP